MSRLLDTNSDLYLKRLAKVLNMHDSIYAPGERLYAFNGFKVVNGQLFYGNYPRVIDPNSLTDGNGNQIVASRSIR